MEQHEVTRRLSQKVTALRCSHLETHTSVIPSSNSETLMELDREEEEDKDGAEREEKSEALSKTPVFSCQTPGLEILQCKYHVAVTEVVELKAELKAVREKLAQRDEGTSEELQKLEGQVFSLEKSCRERHEKVKVWFSIRGLVTGGKQLLYAQSVMTLLITENCNMSNCVNFLFPSAL